MEETPTTDGIISSTMSGIGFASVREASSMRLGSASPLSSEDEDESFSVEESDESFSPEAENSER